MTLKHYILLFNIIIIFLGSVVFVYYRFIDGSFNPIVDISDLHTTKSAYQRGELLQISSSFCKTKTVNTTFQWKLIDHIVTTFPEDSKIPGKGCFKDKVTDVATIPTLLSPGNDYHLEVTVFYEINPLRTIEYTFKSNNFEIK